MLLSDFNGTGIDLTKITTLAIVVEGQVTGTVSVDWGKFAFTPTLPADGSNPAITFLPRNSQNEFAELVGFSSQDGSSNKVTVASQTFATV